MYSLSQRIVWVDDKRILTAYNLQRKTADNSKKEKYSRVLHKSTSKLTLKILMRFLQPLPTCCLKIVPHRGRQKNHSNTRKEFYFALNIQSVWSKRALASAI